MTTINANLEALATALRNREVPMTDSLPTFGGAEPEDTCSVWSWDETRLLIGDCPDTLEIVER